jgi:hypothetical protein
MPWVEQAELAVLVQRAHDPVNGPLQLSELQEIMNGLPRRQLRLCGCVTAADCECEIFGCSDCDINDGAWQYLWPHVQKQITAAAAQSSSATPRPLQQR